MKIYIDKDYICHLNNDGTMREIDTSVFDGMLDEEIESYRFVPAGETWTRFDGVSFPGMMVAPYKDIRDALLVVAMSYLSDDQAESVTILFPEWAVGVAYAVGDRRQFDGLLYKCVQAHTSQADWTPPAVPALWVRTSSEEFPEWVQPTGAHDAYNTGDKVSHNGKHWVSTMDANVYEPGVYGWDEV